MSEVIGHKIVNGVPYINGKMEMGPFTTCTKYSA